MVQDQVPGFELRRVISRSAIATVYEAYQPELNRKAFLKKLHPQFAKDPEIRARFKREAQICARIKHLNLVDIYDYIAQEDQVVLVLEYVEGHSLAELIKAKGPFPVNVTVAILLEILKGLAYAHNKGVIHRDLKPENILISDEGIVKISDWGLSFSPELGVLTHQGMAVGTPAYMSPEAASGGEISFRSDLFSLGVTVYEMLVGKRIFQGESISETLKKVLSDSPPKLLELRSDIPSGIERILTKMLEKSPSKRFATADEVSAKIQDTLEENPMDIGGNVILGFMDVPSSAIQIAPSATEKIRLRKQRTRMASVALIVLVIIAGWLILRPSPEQKKPKKYPAMSTADTLASFPVQAPSDSLLEVTPGTTSGKEPPAIAGLTPQDTAKKPIEKPAQTPVKQPTTGKLQPRSQPETIPEERSTTGQPADTTIELATREPVPRGKGYLQIICDPWANIYVDNRFIAQTPISYDIELDAGSAQLALVNPEFPPIVEQIEIVPGEKKRVSVSLWDYVGVIDVTVRPWADIYVDGELVDKTPLSKPLLLPLGTHYIQLKNPYFQTWEDSLTFAKGDSPVNLKVILEPKE